MPNKSTFNLSTLAKILSQNGYLGSSAAEAEIALHTLFRLAGVEYHGETGMQALHLFSTMLNRLGISFNDSGALRSAEGQAAQYQNASSITKDCDEEARTMEAQQRERAAAGDKIEKLEADLKVVKDELREATRTNRERSANAVSPKRRPPT